MHRMHVCHVASQPRVLCGNTIPSRPRERAAPARHPSGVSCEGRTGRSARNTSHSSPVLQQATHHAHTTGRSAPVPPMLSPGAVQSSAGASHGHSVYRATRTLAPGTPPANICIHVAFLCNISSDCNLRRLIVRDLLKQWCAPLRPSQYPLITRPANRLHPPRHPLMPYAQLPLPWQPPCDSHCRPCTSTLPRRSPCCRRTYCIRHASYGRRRLVPEKVHGRSAAWPPDRVQRCCAWVQPARCRLRLRL